MSHIKPGRGHQSRRLCEHDIGDSASTVNFHDERDTTFTAPRPVRFWVSSRDLGGLRGRQPPAGKLAVIESSGG